ncbi:hypothetical protein Barb6XT_01156 [Bacteroidales bacterium Barb6XT]|nr:hypothetical protein Barb6XT_01156 [Bacteroidales bacterium Barb6XT]
MKKEFGKWLMDIAKYVVTGVLLSAVIKDIGSGTWLYVTGTVISLICLSLGLILINERRVNHD